MNFSFPILYSSFKTKYAGSSIVGTVIAVQVLLLATACSIPNLENRECSEARDNVRELYSIHFGSDMKPSAENLKLRERFLVPELNRFLLNQIETNRDYFTKTDDFPKAFRVGECRVAEPEKKVVVQVLVFWKDDIRSEQKEVSVEMVKETEGWLVNKIE